MKVIFVHLRMPLLCSIKRKETGIEFDPPDISIMKVEPRTNPPLFQRALLATSAVQCNSICILHQCCSHQFSNAARINSRILGSDKTPC